MFFIGGCLHSFLCHLPSYCSKHRSCLHGDFASSVISSIMTKGLIDNILLSSLFIFGSLFLVLFLGLGSLFCSLAFFSNQTLLFHCFSILAIYLSILFPTCWFSCITILPSSSKLYFLYSISSFSWLTYNGCSCLQFFQGTGFQLFCLGVFGFLVFSLFVFLESIVVPINGCSGVWFSIFLHAWYYLWGMCISFLPSSW